MVSDSSNGSNGHVPGRIVELLISNINALTKEIQLLPGALHADMSIELAQISKLLQDINKKLNTPPRNEELHESISGVQKSLDTHQAITEDQLIKHGIVKLQNLMKSLRVIIITVCTIFSLSVILTGIFIDYSNDNLAKELKKDDTVVEVVPNKLEEELKEIKNMVEKHLGDTED